MAFKGYPLDCVVVARACQTNVDVEATVPDTFVLRSTATDDGTLSRPQAFVRVWEAVLACMVDDLGTTEGVIVDIEITTKEMPGFPFYPVLMEGANWPAMLQSIQERGLTLDTAAATAWVKDAPEQFVRVAMTVDLNAHLITLGRSDRMELAKFQALVASNLANELSLVGFSVGESIYMCSPTTTSSRGRYGAPH